MLVIAFLFLQASWTVLASTSNLGPEAADFVLSTKNTIQYTRSGRKVVHRQNFVDTAQLHFHHHSNRSFAAVHSVRDGMLISQASVTHRKEHRRDRFQAQRTRGEHPCFAGFTSVTSSAGRQNRCGDFQRTYPAVGGYRQYRHPIKGYSSVNFELASVVGHFNLWAENGVTEASVQLSEIAVRVADNLDRKDEYVPEGFFARGGQSWLEEVCLVAGILPFDFTCSDKINVLIINCGFNNAFVHMFELQAAYPAPANGDSSNDYDNIFYLCTELLDSSNPADTALVMIHELGHAIQMGFGNSDTTHTEGGATFLESTVLGLPLRPFAFAFGFDDWNQLLAVNIYDTRRATGARKFYQIWAAFYSFLGQDEQLGPELLLASFHYRLWDGVLFGRELYDWFMAAAEDKLTAQSPGNPVRQVQQEQQTAFLDMLVRFRVALMGTCFDAQPVDPRYQWPDPNPFWDCESIPSLNAIDFAGGSLSRGVGYGGCTTVRMLNFENATVVTSSLQEEKAVIMYQTVEGSSWHVLEVASGQGPDGSRRTHLPGKYAKAFVVQVNADPLGEFLEPAAQAEGGGAQAVSKAVWQRQDPGLEPFNYAWHTTRAGVAGLRTPQLRIKTNISTTLTMHLKYELQKLPREYQEQGCGVSALDGLQVRLWKTGVDGESIEPIVLRPTTMSKPGYTTGAYLFAEHYEKPLNCDNVEGWGGSSNSMYERASFDLWAYAGQTVVAEVFFVSADTSPSSVWVDDIGLIEGTTSRVLDNADHIISCFDHVYTTKSDFEPEAKAEAGLVDSSGVPVLVWRGDGRTEDVDGAKHDDRLNMTVSATWAGPAGLPVVRAQAPGYISEFQAEDAPDGPPEALLSAGSEVVVEYPTGGNIGIREVRFFGLRPLADIQTLTVEIRSQDGHSLATRVRPVGPVLMQPIQSFVFDPPVHLPVEATAYQVSLSVASGKTDPIIAVSEQEQHIRFMLSWDDARTWLNIENVNAPNGVLTQQDPWNGKTVPLRVIYEDYVPTKLSRATD